MKIHETLGIDISKLTLDVHLHNKGNHQVFDNSTKGFKALFKWLVQSQSISVNELLICFEHTGIYALPLACFLHESKIAFTMEPAIHIKRSFGLVRGKNDKIDAKRIAEYAYMRKDKLNHYQLPAPELMQLQRLLTLRERMVKQRGGYNASYQENRRALKQKDNMLLFKSMEKVINQFNKQISSIENEITNIIGASTKLNSVYMLITSIKGVGLILGAHLLVSTHCFTSFDCSRKFACYCGIAPFPYQSGTSVKSRNKVSHFANKRMKVLLNLAAQSAVRHDPELKLYYERKIESGKSKMSTLNIVRNKIVHRVFAVVKRGTPYVELHQYAA